MEQHDCGATRATIDVTPARNGAMLRGRTRSVEWRVSSGAVPYRPALAEMEARVDLIRRGGACELVWLLEHPPLLTAGTSARPEELLEPERFEVHAVGRGGRYTYHGPGQRVVYCMLDLSRRGRDLRGYVHRLESWIIATLAHLGVAGERRAGRIGIWVVQEDGEEAKIAALGVRVRHWITYHGISINVAPDLSHFDAIVPSGLGGYGVTSLRAQGTGATMADVDQALKETFFEVFDA